MKCVWLQVRMTTLLAGTMLSLRHRDTTTTIRRYVDRDRRWTDFTSTDGLRAVRRAARLVGGNCLSQSITLTIALTRTGRAPTLILGCHRYGSRKWGAHAWVIMDDEILDARPSGEHEPLAQLDATSHWVPAAIAAGTPGIRKSS